MQGDYFLFKNKNKQKIQHSCLDLPAYVFCPRLFFNQSTGVTLVLTPYLSLLEKQAYCRSCVHGQIPTAESWKGAIASARQSLQTSSSTSFVRSISNDHQDRSGEARQQQRKLVPVFVVGMPRSGSTLLEQMLAQVRRGEGGKCTFESLFSQKWLHEYSTLGA